MTLVDRILSGLRAVVLIEERVVEQAPGTAARQGT